MGRTYLRSANTQDVSDIDESYANFASYTGINESKSFIDVDQNSFEEANNVYVNIDNELSTRPPVNSHNIDVISDQYIVYDIFKVNGITYYKYARTFLTSDVDYIGELSSDVELTVGETYTLDDETCNFTWIDGDETTSGTVLISYYINNILYYAVATYTYTKTVNDDGEVAAESEIYVSSGSSYENTFGNLSYGDTIDLTDYIESDSIDYDSSITNTTVCVLYITYNRNIVYTFYGYFDSSTNTFTIVDFTTSENEITQTLYVTKIYNTGEATMYCITWKYPLTELWTTDICTENTKVFYIQGWYIFTDGKTIYGYKYDYDISSWVKYELEDLIYVPTVTTIFGTSKTTDEGAMNIFTSAYNEVYQLESGIVTDTNDIEGETVTLVVGDETFTLVWSSSYINTLSNVVGICTYSIDTIISSTPDETHVLYIGYCGDWLDVNGDPGCYYSTTADIWAHISFPDDIIAGSFSATLSEQGQTLWIVPYPDDDTTDTITIYYTTLPSTISSTNLTLSWYTITLTVDDINSESCTFGSYYEDLEGYTGTLEYNSIALTTGFPVLIHSIEDGKCVLYYRLDSFTYDFTRTKTNDNGTTDDTSDDVTDEVIISNQSNSTNSALLIVINSYEAVPYVTSDLLGTYVYTNSYYKSTAKIKMSLSTDSYNLITLSGIQINTTASNLTLYMFDIICDEYVPITTWNISTASSQYTVIPSVYNTVMEPEMSSTRYFSTSVNYYYYDFISFVQDNIVTYIICHSKNYSDCYTKITFTLTQTESDVLESKVYFTRYDFTSTSKIISSQYETSKYFTIYRDVTTVVFMTETYIYVDGKIYYYFERNGISTYLPVGMYYSDSTLYYVYWSPDNFTIYSTDYGSVTITRLVTSTDNNIFTDADVTALDISFANELYTTTIATQNLLYQATAAPDGSGKLYFRTDSKVELPDTITGMIYFSQTILAIFVPYTAFEYTASSGDDGIVYYYLYPTKLVLGNRKDYDILQSYDGSTIYICTERGMAGLTYETLVSSTEHIFSYLTDNIFTSYKEFDEQPILFCQYVRWIFMYRQDSNICYIYDMSGSSWWKWTLPYNITKMYADTDNDKLLLIMNYKLYYFNFDADDFHDIETIRIDWSFKSQKLHLSAPNNYKHLRWLSVVTTQDTDTMRYKLKFTNYRHWHHMQDSSVVEYEINQLGTMRKKINFVKCNAFQFEISNDKTWKQPEKFVISNIAIKYRITEGIR